MDATRAAAPAATRSTDKTLTANRAGPAACCADHSAAARGSTPILAFLAEAACCNSVKDSYGNPGISDTDGPCVLCLICPQILCALSSVTQAAKVHGT